jgi:uncharacterized protein
MLVDANLLLYAVDRKSRFHAAAAEWLTRQLNGPRRVGLPWQSLVAFIRISTNPRASAAPLDPGEALRHVQDWLAPEVAWIPSPGAQHAKLLADLVDRYQLRANLVSDAHLAALALEHGLTLCSADSDFARFRELSWTNPVS